MRSTLLLATIALSRHHDVAAALHVQHILQCVGAPAGTIVDTVAAHFEEFPTADEIRGRKPLSIVMIGTPTDGLHYLVDLLGNAVGKAAVIDLGRDVSRGSTALSAEASKRVRAQLGDGRAASGALVKVTKLERLGSANITSANILMRMLDTHAAIPPADTHADDIPLGRDGAAAVLVTFDASSIEPSIWAVLDRQTAREFLRARLQAAYEAWMAGPSAETLFTSSTGLSVGTIEKGGDRATRRAMNIDALMGRIDAVVVLPPQSPLDVERWRDMRANNPLCAVPPLPETQEQVGSWLAQMQARWTAGSGAGEANSTAAAPPVLGEAAAAAFWGAVLGLEAQIGRVLPSLQAVMSRVLGAPASDLQAAFLAGLLTALFALLLMVLCGGGKGGSRTKALPLSAVHGSAVAHRTGSGSSSPGTGNAASSVVLDRADDLSLSPLFPAPKSVGKARAPAAAQAPKVAGGKAGAAAAVDAAKHEPVEVEDGDGAAHPRPSSRGAKTARGDSKGASKKAPASQATPHVAARRGSSKPPAAANGGGEVDGPRRRRSVKQA